MGDDRRGHVVTFYSFTGGGDRTMALANVAWILAAAGHKVLAADWDLESPGLHRFFHPFMDADVFDNQGGVIDLIREYEDISARQDPRRPPDWHEEQARARRLAFPLDTGLRSGGELHFLSAGRQNQDYRVSVGGLDWDAFFEAREGALFFEALRASMKRDYDYTLINARAGLSDFADICTLHLPDTLVDCFTLSDHGIEGAAMIARRVARTYRSRNIRVLPVPVRVDHLAEQPKLDAGRAMAMHRFAQFPEHLAEPERARYWSDVEVPYSAFYAFEETLATFGDPPGARNTLLAAYERLTGYLTDQRVTALAEQPEADRVRVLDRFRRQVVTQDDEITLRYAPADQVWAEWAERVLQRVDVRVNDPWRRPGEQGTVRARTMVLLSRSYSGADSSVLPRDDGSVRPPLAVYLTDLAPLPRYPSNLSAHLHGQQHHDAVEAVLRLVGRRDEEVVARVAVQVGRYPGTPPAIFHGPARNLRFTGREEQLRELRQRLLELDGTALLPGSYPVVLQGMGGVGKTQLAMEYAYRYRTAYDIVWWINADPPQFIDTQLMDLGGRLHGRAVQTPQAVLAALARSDFPPLRWLIVFDNAEEIGALREFLPQGAGHVLLTSRNLQWRDTVDTMPVEVFARRESITLLRRRLGTISTDDAHRVADALGDLPVAVAAAGAWLADTGMPVERYLRQVFQQDARVLPDDDPSSWQIGKTWDLSLTVLRQRSPGAYRLLQLCSVLAPQIAPDLIYSDAMGEALRPYDPRAADRMDRARLVQQINRLALLKLDVRAGVHVHRLLQHVVRERMSAQELAAARHDVHLILAAVRPSGDVDDPRHAAGFRMLWPHLEICGAVDCTDEAVRELLVDWVRSLWLRDAYAQGEQAAAWIAARWQEPLPPLAGDPGARDVLRRQLLSLRAGLANLLREQGRFRDALAIDEAVLAEQRTLLGETSPYTLMTAGGLAADLRALGRYAEALRLDQRTCATWSSDYGDDYPRTLAAQGDLAASHRLLGDFRAARRHDEDVHQRRRVVLGPDHAATLHSAATLARDLRDAGDYDRSAELLREVLQTAIRAHGDDARITLNTRANLGVSLRSAGRPREAEDLLESAYERLLDGFGAEHPDTLACRLSRAVNIYALGDLEAARREMTGVHEAYRHRLGDRHPHTIACLSNLAAVDRGAGVLADALRCAADAADGFAEVLPAEHPFVLVSRMNVAVCAAELEPGPTPLGDLRLLLERLRQRIGPDHPDTLRCAANVALLLRHRPFGDEPTDVDGVQVLTRLRARLGVAHPAVAAFEERRYLYRVLDPHPY
ncbi:tetratricopeptide repeat protein [Dactylosporangium aurantiacum]|uniref:Tetratricopeptide repeat protein n=1 Tax=Dactylosporangium aurantiacum TaxID=35754 RepID=A0A9Q9MM88_9ACTN|nr:FxSxx-COOH system tetratricopeptide repeat protein [Dactylosporangium aurantiacum]MDG6107965.1 FxSxx-COOH system tetratricopeptide repeat protein [Dactylosporangium aurantiacum]UWZ59755.1 tetratricopeptide repeat protein [Dactylosporangium aurantiacum]